MRNTVEQGDVLELLATGAEGSADRNTSDDALKPAPTKPRLPAYVQSM